MKSFIWLSVIFFCICIFACGGSEEGSSEDIHASVEVTAASNNRNVILIIIDTLRADHLSCYGYRRFTSPSIDSLAAAGTMWTKAYAQAPWTLPAHATMWTGLTVRSHGTEIDALESQSESGYSKFLRMLDPELPALPVILEQNGFSTYGIANTVILGEEFGFDVGFQRYHCNPDGNGMAASSVDTLIQWLTDNGDDRFFCMLHLFDVHSPYSPPVPYNSLFAENREAPVIDYWTVDEDSVLNPEDRDVLVSLYDGEIAWVDDNLRRLFGFLRNHGLSDETLIIVTSDHGEEFLEHGWINHGFTLHEEILHIPLVMAGPGIPAGAVDSTPVGQFDLPPTVLNWYDVDVSVDFEGMDILAETIPAERPIPASGVNLMESLDSRHIASVILHDRKTILKRDLQEMVSYDLEEDPGEQIPVPADSLGSEEVLYYWATPPRGFPEYSEESEEAHETLMDLGYI